MEPSHCPLTDKHASVCSGRRDFLEGQATNCSGRKSSGRKPCRRTGRIHRHSCGPPGAIHAKLASTRITWCRDLLRLNRRYRDRFFADCHSPEPAHLGPVTLDVVALLDAENCRQRSGQRTQEFLLCQRFQFTGGSDLHVEPPEFGGGHVRAGLAHKVTLGEQNHRTGPRWPVGCVQVICRNEMLEQFERLPYQINFSRGHAITTHVPPRRGAAPRRYGTYLELPTMRCRVGNLPDHNCRHRR
jgi:hypothetical protein